MSRHQSSLERRINALQDNHRSTLQLITRLSNLKFQPGSLPLNDEEGPDVRSELTSEIHDNLKKEDEELEILQQEVQERKDQSRLAIQTARLAEDFKIARTRFRAAQVQSKRNAQLARAQERDLLFSSRSDGTGEDAPFRRRNLDKQKGGQDEVTAASGDVTAALRRTHQLLQTEVQRSHFAQEIFNQSSEAIKQLSESYNDLDTLLSSSRTLLTTLVKSQKSDTWYLETTFYILAITIAWLVFRRLLYGPLWWLAWVPLKLTYRMLFAVFSIVGFGRGTQTTALSSASPNTVPLASTSIAPSVNMADQATNPEKKSGSEGSHPLTDKVAEMVEKIKDGGKKEEVKRGDGTPLVSSDAPRNPKKRMFEGEPPVREKDEL